MSDKHTKSLTCKWVWISSYINYEEFGGSHCLLVCDLSRILMFEHSNQIVTLTAFWNPICVTHCICCTAGQIYVTRMFWLIKHDESIM